MENKNLASSLKSSIFKAIINLDRKDEFHFGVDYEKNPEPEVQEDDQKEMSLIEILGSTIKQLSDSDNLNATSKSKGVQFVPKIEYDKVAAHNNRLKDQVMPLRSSIRDTIKES
jgi:hypothetical protein